MAKKKKAPAGKKFRKVQKEFGKRKLKSSSGEVVEDIDQARAIGFSEQRRADNKKARSRRKKKAGKKKG
jgi:hypothetical protein